MLLLFGEHAQLLMYVWILLEATVANDCSRLSISFSLGAFIMLGPHVHVPGCISGITLPAVVVARKLLLEVSRTSSDVFFAVLLIIGRNLVSEIFQCILVALSWLFIVTTITVWLAEIADVFVFLFVDRVVLGRIQLTWLLIPLFVSLLLLLTLHLKLLQVFVFLDV